MIYLTFGLVYSSIWIGEALSNALRSEVLGNKGENGAARFTGAPLAIRLPQKPQLPRYGCGGEAGVRVLLLCSRNVQGRAPGLAVVVTAAHEPSDAPTFDRRVGEVHRVARPKDGALAHGGDQHRIIGDRTPGAAAVLADTHSAAVARVKVTVAHVGHNIPVAQLHQLGLVHLQQRAVRYLECLTVVVGEPDVILHVCALVPDEQQPSRVVRVGRRQLQAHPGAGVRPGRTTDFGVQVPGGCPRAAIVTAQRDGDVETAGLAAHDHHHLLLHRVPHRTRLAAPRENTLEGRPATTPVRRALHTHVTGSTRHVNLVLRVAAIADGTATLREGENLVVPGEDDGGDAGAGVVIAVGRSVPGPEHNRRVQAPQWLRCWRHRPMRGLGSRRNVLARLTRLTGRQAGLQIGVPRAVVAAADVFCMVCIEGTGVIASPLVTTSSAAVLQRVALRCLRTQWHGAVNVRRAPVVHRPGTF
eukprot:Hpha_TRINITY_DN7435_c0_g1::TRINITY_DN7435_c0_g1_i1::g.95994::m.95994